MSSSHNSPVIAVTGAAGYIGSRVVERIQVLHPEWEVRPVDNFYNGSIRRIADATVEHADVRDRDQLEDAIGDADVVMHLAALSGVDDCQNQPDLAYEVNVQGTNNVAWFCRKTGAGLVFPTSMATIGDPVEFPLTTDHPRSPLNWYGRTKLLGERSIEEFAAGAFPAHVYLVSNLYGEHTIDGKRISKNMLINIFIDRVAEGVPLTVYKPGTQSRNYVHVKDVARAYVRSGEVLLEQLSNGETGIEKFPIASSEDPSVERIAEYVRQIAAEEFERDVEIEHVDNPRTGETLVEEFPVDTDPTKEALDWEVKHGIEESIRKSIRAALGDTPQVSDGSSAERKRNTGGTGPTPGAVVFDDLEDGTGCTEIWEYLGERR